VIGRNDHLSSGTPKAPEVSAPFYSQATAVLNGLGFSAYLNHLFKYMRRAKTKTLSSYSCLTR
jgi:hypothetical protein